SRYYSSITTSYVSIVPVTGLNPVISPLNKSLFSFKSAILFISSIYSGTAKPTSPFSYHGSSKKTTSSLYSSYYILSCTGNRTSGAISKSSSAKEHIGGHISKISSLTSYPSYSNIALHIFVTAIFSGQLI